MFQNYFPNKQSEDDDEDVGGDDDDPDMNIKQNQIQINNLKMMKIMLNWIEN